MHLNKIQTPQPNYKTIAHIRVLLYESVVYWCDARSAGEAWIFIHQWQRESAQSAITAGTVLQSADHEHWKLSAHSDTCRDRCRGTVSCHSGETKCKPNVNVLLGHCILAAWCCNASAANFVVQTRFYVVGLSNVYASVHVCLGGGVLSSACRRLLVVIRPHCMHRVQRCGLLCQLLSAH